MFFSALVTNRGVDLQNKKNSHAELQVLIDWCQITVKDVSTRIIAEEILGIPYELMRNDFRGGLKGGYLPLMCFNDIRVFEPGGKNRENGYQILMAGKGCRNFEKILEFNGETWYDFLERVMTYEVNIPRIDLAIDDRKTYFKISKLIRLAEKGMVVSRMRIGSKVGAFGLAKGEHMGDTINFGSRASELYMTFYEKNYERAAKTGQDREEVQEKWNRYELKFRQKKAVKVVKELIKRREVYQTAFEALNEAIRFVKKPEGTKSLRVTDYPLWEPWAWFMHDVKKLKLATKAEDKDYFEKLAWLKNMVAPTLWIYREIDRELGTDVIGEIISDARLDRKHYQMKEDYLNQLKTEQALAAYQREKLLRKIELQKEGFVYCEDGERIFNS